jgi:hypothetical protein
LLVHSFPKASAAFARHYPLWRKCGFEQVVGIATTGGGCSFPDGVQHVEIGRDSYMDGDHLCRRLTDTIAYGLGLPCDSFAIIEYDTLVFRHFPEPTDKLITHLAGFQVPGCLGHKFYHTPWIASKATWHVIHRACQDLLACGEIERGTPDCFLGWACEKHSIPVDDSCLKAYSLNTIGMANVSEARAHLARGAYCMHGVKSKEVLDAILK